MNDNTIEIKVKFEKVKLHKDDIGNLECNFCDRPCQSTKENWWDSETEYTILSICEECVKKYRIEG